jgi:hypothetical membrane protein
VLVIRKLSKVTAGIILFVGSFQWLMMLVILESFHPNYNSALHYVSSFGSGNTAIIYNISIILLGLCVALSSVILYYSIDTSTKTIKLFLLLLLITGIFVIGVGVFPENVRPMHGYVTPFAFIFAIASAIVSYKVVKAPFSYISLCIGLSMLVGLIMFFPYVGLPRESTITFLGLMKGTIERIIIYPLMFWMVSYSVTLMMVANSS